MPGGVPAPEQLAFLQAWWASRQGSLPLSLAARPQGLATKLQ